MLVAACACAASAPARTAGAGPLATAPINLTLVSRQALMPCARGMATAFVVRKSSYNKI